MNHPLVYFCRLYYIVSSRARGYQPWALFCWHLISRFFCLLFALSYRLREGVDVISERLDLDKTNPFLRPRILNVNGLHSILNNGSEKVWTTQSKHHYRVINSKPFRL